MELKERKRQIHKMHEVYGRLKEKFVAGGGSAAAFDAARDVDGLEYGVRFAESRRAAERKRAEQLALDLGKAQRELERARRAAGTALGEGHRANAGGFERRRPRGEATDESRASSRDERTRRPRERRKAVVARQACE